MFANRHICLALAAAVIFGLPSCAAPPDNAGMHAVYDPVSARLMQLSADQNRDGRVDQWTYLDGNRPLRGEGDANGDGRIDRWEYFDANAQLIRVGSSSVNDGVEDMWTVSGPNPRVELSRRRDRHVDRVEFYDGSSLVRGEEDTNADGRVDAWFRYDAGVLREASFDTSFSHGRPNRRLLYDAKGQFQAIEADEQRTGTFVRLSDTAAAAAKAGVQR